MGHLVREAQLVNSCRTVAAADDRCCRCLSQRFSYCNRTFCQDRILEYAHRSVPDNGLGRLHCICIQLGRLRTDIQTFFVSRNLVSVNYFYLNLGINRIRKTGSNGRVNRQKQLLAQLLSLSHHLFTVVKFLVVYQRVTDFHALCFQEGKCHTAADDQRITLLQQVVDNVQLISYFSAAEDRYERSYRVLHCVAQEVDLFLH